MNDETTLLLVRLQQAILKKDDEILGWCLAVTDKELIRQAVVQLQQVQYEVLFLRVMKKRTMVWLTALLDARPDYFTTSSKLQQYLKHLQAAECSKLSFETCGKL
jgi:hypothetical protein